jgi:hypothetical protein
VPINPPKENEDAQLVGVENLWELTSPNLKWQALMFDRIGAPFLNAMLGDQVPGGIQWLSINELRWLVDQGFLFDAGFPASLQKWEELHQTPEYVHEYDHYLRVLSRKGIYQNELEEIRDSLQFMEYWPRLAAIQLNRENRFRAVPISRIAENSPPPYRAGDQEVLEVVLNRIPQPDESVAWEQIMEFRNDPDSKGKFWALRAWMSEIAKEQLRRHEIVEKLESSLHEYGDHMKLHRMKIDWGTLRTLVSVGAGVAEGLVKFQWSKAAEILFGFHDRKIALLEAEAGAPGRELAYIVAAREKFNSPGAAT